MEECSRNVTLASLQKGGRGIGGKVLLECLNSFHLVHDLQLDVDPRLKLESKGSPLLSLLCSCYNFPLGLLSNKSSTHTHTHRYIYSSILIKKKKKNVNVPNIFTQPNESHKRIKEMQMKRQCTSISSCKVQGFEEYLRIKQC